MRVIKETAYRMLCAGQLLSANQIEVAQGTKNGQPITWCLQGSDFIRRPRQDGGTVLKGPLFVLNDLYRGQDYIDSCTWKGVHMAGVLHRWPLYVANFLRGRAGELKCRWAGVYGDCKTFATFAAFATFGVYCLWVVSYPKSSVVVETDVG